MSASQAAFLALKRYFTESEASTCSGLSQRTLDYAIAHGELVAYLTLREFRALSR